MHAPWRKVKRFPQDHTDEQVGKGALKVPVIWSHTPIITQTPSPRTWLSRGHKRNTPEVRARKSGEVLFPACSAAHWGAPDVSRRASGSAQGRWFPAPGEAREVKPVGVSLLSFETQLSRFPFMNVTPKRQKSRFSNYPPFPRADDFRRRFEHGARWLAVRGGPEMNTWPNLAANDSPGGPAARGFRDPWAERRVGPFRSALAGTRRRFDCHAPRSSSRARWRVLGAKC